MLLLQTGFHPLAFSGVSLKLWGTNIKLSKKSPLESHLSLKGEGNISEHSGSLYKIIYPSNLSLLYLRVPTHFYSLVVDDHKPPLANLPQVVYPSQYLALPVLSLWQKHKKKIILFNNSIYKMQLRSL